MWYYEKNGSQLGPTETSELRPLFERGELHGGSLIWREGMPDWSPASQVDEFKDLVATAPAFVAPAAPAHPQPRPMDPSMMPPKTNGLAVTSMILGIVSLPLSLFCAIGILLGLPAIICGHIARGKIRTSNGSETGNGFALTGLITGYLDVVLNIIVGIFIVLSYNRGKEEVEKVKQEVEIQRQEQEERLQQIRENAEQYQPAVTPSESAQ
jgi:hypothetical protein